MLLIGIPGALFLELVNTLFRAAGNDVLRKVADGAWPMALVISMVWPWPLPLGAVWFARSKPNVSTKIAYFFGLFVAVAFGFLASAALIAVQ